MKRNRKREIYPSLYDAFDLGDRVKRLLIDEHGKNKEYRGVVLAIDDNSIEIYWDTVDGKYRPGYLNAAFTNCSINEIFKGNKQYTPIKKDRY